MAYLKTAWLVDGIKNKLYGFENGELQQESYTIPVVNSNAPVGDCKLLVHTDQKSVYILSPTGYLFKFDTKMCAFTRTIRLTEGSSGIAQGPLNECTNSTPILVSNYNENTVSVIVNDSIQYDIPVGLGPTNIIFDGNGIAYVCNSIENTISIINYYNCKYVSYKKIRLLSNPIDVCVDSDNILYVLCKDNKVYKLVSDTSSKRLSFDVGETPSAISCDNKNNILVTNYDDGSLTIIDPNSIIKTIGLTEYHPVAVDGDADDNILVITCHNIIIKLNQAGKIIHKFYANLPTSVTTLNDFTGMKTKKSISSDSTSGGISQRDLDNLKTELDNKIQSYSNKDSFPDPSSNPNDKSIYIDEENGVLYRFDKEKQDYKVLYGTNVSTISYDIIDDTVLSVYTVDGSKKPLDLKDITNTVLAGHNTIQWSMIDELF